MRYSMTLTLATTLMFPPLCVLDDVRVALLPPVVVVLEGKEAAAPPVLLLVSLFFPTGGLAERSSPCTSSTQIGCLELRMLATLGLQDSCKD